MDASTWTEITYTNHNQERTVAFPRQNSTPVTLDAEVSVMVLYADPVIAAGLAAVLHEESGFRLVSAPGRGDVGFGPPVDVVLADYETAMSLVEQAPQWANNLLVFTNQDSEAKISRALESGVRGYLLYGIGLTKLFEGIRCVQGGGVALSPLVAARITHRIRGATLTAREKAVLGHLMLGLSNKMIANKLNLCVGTIKTHVKSILVKLDANSRTAAVVTAQRRGLLP